jgi:hypothetical protein
MKPVDADYEILYWMDNFGYLRKVIHATDAFKAITIHWKALENNLI